MIQIISNNDPLENAFWLYESYRIVINNAYKDKYTIREFKHLKDINIGDIIFIIDDHNYISKKYYLNNDFLDTVNRLECKVIILTIEKAYSSFFLETTSILEFQKKINNKVHFSSDAGDCKILQNPPVKQILSKTLYDKIINENQNKKNKIVFIGQLANISIQPWYSNRNKYFNYINTLHAPIDFYASGYNLEKYFSILAEYKYVFNPLGIGDFLSMRYHEALSLGCIPIQQYSESMTGIYEEIENSNGLFFKNEKELSEIVESIKNNECIIKTKKYFLEEYFFNKLYPKIGI